MIGDGQYLWIGTNGGLVKFDRISRSYNVLHPSNSGLLMNAVTSLTKDREGALWVASRGAGVARLKDGNWTHFTSKDHNFGSGVIWAMSTDSAGTVWFGCDSGLVSYRDARFSRLTMEKAPFQTNNIFSLMTDRSGALWVGTQMTGSKDPERASVLRLKDGKWEVHNASTDVKFQSGSPYSIFEAKNGDMWFGFQSKVARLKDKTWETYAAIPSDGLYNYVYGLNEDANGTMYMTTSYGASRFDGTKWNVMSDYPLASGISIVSAEEGLWFCASQIDGIALLKNNLWESYHELSHTALPTNYVNAMTIDAHGVYWFAGNGHEVTSFDGETWKQYQFLNADTDRVVSLAADSSGNLWIGTISSGFCKWDGSKVTYYNRSNSPMISNSIFTIAYDKKRDGLWLGGRTDQKSDSTVKGSLLWYGGNSWRNYYPSNSKMPWVEFNDIEIDEMGDIWIAFPYFGVSRFDGAEEWTTFNAENSDLANNMPNDLAIDRKGHVWVASYSGAASYDGSNWKAFSREHDGLGSDALTSVTIDAAGDVWFGAYLDQTGGLVRFNGSEWRHYTVFDSPVGSLLILKMMADDKGNIFAGTYDAGIVAHHYGTLNSSAARKASEQLVCFPNPASDIVTLKLEDSGIASVYISDILGREVLTQTIDASEPTLDVSKLLPGTYFLVIEQQDTTRVENLIVY